MSKFISIIIPCRDEEKFIADTIGSLLSQDYEPPKFQILIVDGRSQDGTRAIIQKFEQDFPGRVRLVDNPEKTTPYALNYGVKAARGDLIIIMGAHAYYPKDYLSKCAEAIAKYNVDCVGGIIKTLPAHSHTPKARAIAMALASPFGVGNSYFRTGVTEPRDVDTVPFGCYRKEVFEKAGLFDTDFIRNQDDEFNHRLRKMGFKLLLIPGIESSYYARDSWSKLWMMYFQYGYFKPLSAAKHGRIFTLRQVVPAVFAGSLIFFLLAGFIWVPALYLFLLDLFLYVGVNLWASNCAANRGDARLIPFLSVSFAILHFGYGIGYLKGLWDFVFLRGHLHNKVKDVSLTR